MARAPIARFEKIANLSASGLTWKEIGQRLGIPIRTLRDLRKTQAFKDVCDRIEGEVLQGAADVMIAGAHIAAKVLVEVAADDRFEVRDRLVACKYLADNARVFSDRRREKEKQDDDSDLIKIPGRGDE